MQRRSNRTVYAVLGFLTWRPMSGYDIKKCVEDSTSNFWSESYGQIYPILRRLADEGLAERQPRAKRTRGARDRQLYALTERGRAALRRWLEQATEPPSPRNELLLKLFFGRQVDVGVMRRQLEVYRRRQHQILDKYGAIRAQLTTLHRDEPDLPYWLMTLSYGEREQRTLLEWCDETLATLEKLGVPARATRRSRSRPTSQTPSRPPALPLRSRRKGGPR